MELTSLKMTVSAVAAAGAMLVGGVSYISKVEATAKSAEREAREAKSLVKEIQKDLHAQRILIADIQGDSKAILSLLKHRSGAQD